MNDHPPTSTLPRHSSATSRRSPPSRRRALFRPFDRAALSRAADPALSNAGPSSTCLAALAAAWFDAHFTVALNVTESLPVRLFLIQRVVSSPAGATTWLFVGSGGGPYPAGVTFIKEIAGMSGDVVTRVERDYFVNGQRRGPSQASQPTRSDARTRAHRHAAGWRLLRAFPAHRTAWIPGTGSPAGCRRPRSSVAPMRCSEPRFRPQAMVITAIAAVALLASHCAHARDLGVIGPVYAIAEPSLLEVIQTKLRQMQANGDLSRLQRESQARIQREVEQPAPVPGITKTTRARSFHFDPSIEVPYPITDADGRVIVAPGTGSIRSTPCRCRVPCCSSMRATPRAGRPGAAPARRAQGPSEADPDRRLLPRPDAALEAGRCSTTSRATSPPSSGSARCPRSSRRTARGCASMNCCSSATDPSAPPDRRHPGGAGQPAGRPRLPPPGRPATASFMNPITDICWSCMFPLTLGSATLVSDGQPDIGNPSSPVCFCSNPPRIGVSIGFWEPVRLVDVTRTPFCMVGLGGLALDPGSRCRAARRSATTARRATASTRCTGTPTRS
jgi:hypothetical protein